MKIPKRGFYRFILLLLVFFINIPTEVHSSEVLDKCLISKDYLACRTIAGFYIPVHQIEKVYLQTSHISKALEITSYLDMNIMFFTELACLYGDKEVCRALALHYSSKLRDFRTSLNEALRYKNKIKCKNGNIIYETPKETASWNANYILSQIKKLQDIRRILCVDYFYQRSSTVCSGNLDELIDDIMKYAVKCGGKIERAHGLGEPVPKHIQEYIKLKTKK